MKKILFVLFTFLIFVTGVVGQTNLNHEYVKGYTRKDGTYVKGYYRTAPNNTNRDNFSTQGNVNPYTGQSGWVTPDNNSAIYYNENNSFLNSSNKTYWKASSSGYNFYFKGSNVKTTNEWRGNDLIVYYDKYAYLIKDYDKNKDGIKRYPIQLATWSSHGNGYFFYLNEESVGLETTNEWFGEDLIVYHGNNGYILADYKKYNDGRLRVALPIPTWSSLKDRYFFYINGKSVANKTENKWNGNDLLVEYKNKTYLLQNYKNLKDGKIRFAVEYKNNKEKIVAVSEAHEEILQKEKHVLLNDLDYHHKPDTYGVQLLHVGGIGSRSIQVQAFLFTEHGYFREPENWISYFMNNGGDIIHIFSIPGYKFSEIKSVTQDGGLKSLSIDESDHCIVNLENQLQNKFLITFTKIGY